MTGALSHLRVLDLTRVLAGPWATQTLADLGADVIKVERPRVGDDSRHLGPPWLKDGEGRDTADSTYFSSANRNKRSVTVDLSSEDGQALVRQMAAHCDVLVENYKVGDLARYGLSYEQLSATHPGLIYCSVTGYGQDGPYAERPGYDYVFQGEGGLMSVTGEREDRPGGGPMKVGIAVVDIMAGLYACIAIVSAVEARHRTGRGQHIDTALLDTIVAAGAHQIAGSFVSGQAPTMQGNAHATVVPYQPFRTLDGRIIVACANDGQYRKLCAVLERPDLGHDPRYRTAPGRDEYRIELLAEIERTMRQQPTAHWAERLAAAGVPSGPINDYKQVFEHPQVIHRGLRVDLDRGAAGPVALVASPLRLSDTPVSYRLPPPRLGEHTDEVLAELLGMAATDVEALRARGIV